MIGDDYDQRFAGLGRLLGRDALKALAAAHVCVVGSVESARGRSKASRDRAWAR